MIERNGVLYGFPLSILLVGRRNTRRGLRTERDVLDCLREEADIIRRHGTFEAFWAYNRKRRAERIRLGQWDTPAGIAKGHNNRAAKFGVPGRLTGDDVRRLFAEYGHACLACGSRDNLAVDHIVSMSRGGHNVYANLQPLCVPCNSKKRSADTDYRPRKASGSPE